MRYSEIQPEKGWGWVYLETHKNANGLFKIGFTRHPKQRQEQLGGNDFTVICRVMAVDPEKLERELHEQFDSERLPQTEYFAMGESDVGDCVAQMLLAHGEATQFAVLPGNEKTLAFQDTVCELELAEALIERLVREKAALAVELDKRNEQLQAEIKRGKQWAIQRAQEKHTRMYEENKQI